MYFFIGYFSLVILGLLLSFFLFAVKKVLSAGYIFAILSVTLTTEILLANLDSSLEIKQLISTIYSPIEFIIVVLYCHSVLQNYRKFWMFFPAVVIVSFCVVNMCLIQGIGAFNTYSNLVIDAGIVFYSLYYFMQLIKDKTYINYFKTPAFWFFSGFLFYVCGDMLYSGTTNFLWKFDLDLAYLVGDIFKAVNILLYLFLFIATLCLIPEKSSSPSSAS